MERSITATRQKVNVRHLPHVAPVKAAAVYGTRVDHGDWWLVACSITWARGRSAQGRAMAAISIGEGRQGSV
eukprot:scaffold13347_cov27-Tisochrysis_lutea.AAC.4